MCAAIRGHGPLPTTITVVGGGPLADGCVPLTFLTAYGVHLRPKTGAVRVPNAAGLQVAHANEVPTPFPVPLMPAVGPRPCLVSAKHGTRDGVAVGGAPRPLAAIARPTVLRRVVARGARTRVGAEEAHVET